LGSLSSSVLPRVSEARGIGAARGTKSIVTERPRSLPARLRMRFFHLSFLATRAMTVGVRAAVFDTDGRVFLVRHTYVPGWHFPGGGVEVGETALDALARELTEEGNIVPQEEPQLHGFYFNAAVSRRDHIAFYIVHHFVQSGPRNADREIAETGFFNRDALPEGTSRPTRSRLQEIFGGAALSSRW
jgi:8-oxo-dGTP pyrophosphatase MutT (NUDIX family)